MHLMCWSGKRSLIGLTYASSTADADTLRYSEVMEVLLIGTGFSISDYFNCHGIFRATRPLDSPTGWSMLCIR